LVVAVGLAAAAGDNRDRIFDHKCRKQTLQMWEHRQEIITLQDIVEIVRVLFRLQ